MHHTIILPDLGQTTNEARIANWLKRAGEHVKRGEPLVVVETDKVNVDVEAFETGYLRETLVAEGELAAALMPIAILTDTEDEPYSLPQESQAAAPLATSEVAKAPAAVIPGRPRVAPAARAKAARLGVDLSRISGTGAAGLITSKDVERAGMGAIPSLRAMHAMAASVSESKRDIPHFYATMDMAMDHAAAWRSNRNGSSASHHVTYNDLLVRCAALALADSPRMRTRYAGGKFQQHPQADVIVIKEQDGTLLYTPLPNAAEISWEDLQQAIRRDGVAAPATPLFPTLAISNLGMYGVREFSAIIPPACTAILAVGAVRQEAAIADDGIRARSIASVTLSADHRVIDGITAARYLQRLQHHLNSL